MTLIHQLKSLPLETERLILAPIGPKHLADIFDYAKRPEVSRYTMWEPHHDLEETKEFYRDYILSNYAVGTPEPLGIFLKDRPNQCIGTIGAFYTSEAHRIMELAYALHPDYWGKGIVYEASLQFITWCFERLPIHRFQCRCKSPNKGSRRVMEKLGMTYEGVLRDSITHRGQLWDMEMFSFTHQQWREHPANTSKIKRSLQLNKNHEFQLGSHKLIVQMRNERAVLVEKLGHDESLLQAAKEFSLLETQADLIEDCDTGQ